MPRFRSIPVEVDAEQWLGPGEEGNEDLLISFTGGQFNALDDADRLNCDDPAATGQLFESRGVWRLVYDGDWIVREDGRIYRCRPKAFAAQFEAVPQ